MMGQQIDLVQLRLEDFFNRNKTTPYWHYSPLCILPGAHKYCIIFQYFHRNAET